MYFLFTALHSFSGSRVSVPRRELSPAELPEDEASDQPYEGVQAEKQRRLPDLQTTHRAVLLPRETLSGEQMSGAVLLQHQAQTQATTAPAEVAASAVAAKEDGGHVERYPANCQSDSGCDEYRYGRWWRAVGGRGCCQSC